MHIKLLYRKVLYVFLSLMIVFANTQTAFAASSWGITSAVSAGARTVVTATKGGYKSAVNIAPTAGRLALKLGKGANWAALVYAAIQLAPDIADIDSFKPNYSNNTVDYKTKATYYWTRSWPENVGKHPTPEAACRVVATLLNQTYLSFDAAAVQCRMRKSDGSLDNWSVMKFTNPVSSLSVDIDIAAGQVLKNANAGHAPSQAATRETATEMVIGGQFDQDLMQGAVPIADSKPLVPSVPISGNGNQSYGGVGVGDDGLMTGGDVGKAAGDAVKAAEDAKRSSDAARDAVKAAEDRARELSDAASDLINNNEATEAAIAEAKAAAAAATKAAEAAKAVAEAAARAAAERARTAEAATAEAVKAATAAAEKAAADLAAAKAAGDAAAIAAAEAAKAAADAAVAAANERAAAAEKAAARAREEAAKPFELPAFCSWAKPVCDYMTWVKSEYAGMKEWLTVEAVDSVDENVSITETIEDGWQDKVNGGYVSFARECPADVLIPVELMGASQTLNISYMGFCHFASLIRPAVILGAWISGLLIISGGRARE